MSVHYGPGLINDGIALDLDLENTNHCFRGGSTTNLLGETTPGIYLNTPSDVSVSLTLTSPVQYYRGSRVWKWVATPTTATGVGYLQNGNNPGIGIVTGGGGGPANQYTGFSIYWRPTGAVHSNPVYNGYSNIPGWQNNTSYNSMGDGWFRSHTLWYDTVTRSDGKYWAFNPANAVLNRPITWYVCGFFKEQENRSAYISRWTRSSRTSITGAGTGGQANESSSYAADRMCVVDMAGNHIVQDNEIPITANANFEEVITDFNGTSHRFNYSAVPPKFRSVGNSTNRTWEVVFRINNFVTNTAYAIFGHKVGTGCSYYCNGGIYVLGNAITYNWYDNSNYQFLSSGITPVSNQYYHVVGTWNASDLKSRIYVNGILRNTSAASNNNYGTTEYWEAMFNSKNQYGGGGSSDYTNGRIPIIRWYVNKCLSDAEVRQNYDAFKGRFNLL